MGIPGSPLPNLPPSDESSSVPIPKVSESRSTNLQLSTSDKLFETEATENKDKADLTRIFLPREGRLSLIEFVRIINKNLSLFEQTQEAIELMDELMNKKLHRSLADGSSSLRKYRAQIESFLSRWSSVESEIEELTTTVNRLINEYNKSPLEQNRSTLNRAIENYNSQIVEQNEIIKDLNGEMQFLGLEEIRTLTPLALVPKEQKDPKKLTLLPERMQPDVAETLRLYYEPVQNATIGYMSNLNQVLDVNKEQNMFDQVMMKAVGGIFLDLLLVKFSAVFYDLIGEGSTNDASLAKAISWTTLERLLAGSAIRSSMVEARIPLTPGEIQEIQLLILNIMTKAAIQSATGPAFQVLGQDLGRVSVDDQHISAALSLALMSRIKSLVESGVVKDNITSLIENNPRISSFPAKDRSLLAKKLTAIVSLAVLQNALVHASIALGAPGLVGQVLNLSLEEVGIGRTLGGGTFNDVLADRSVTTMAAAALVDDLIGHGFNDEDALDLVKQAMANTLAYGAFTNFGEFTNTLAMQFYTAGIPDVSLARALAIKGADILQTLAPRAALEERKILSGFTIGMVDPDALKSSRALKIILEGYDREAFESLYKKAIDDVFNAATVGSLVSSFSANPLFTTIQQPVAPKTVRDVLIELFKGLVRHGSSVEDSLGIAESTLKYLLRSKEAQNGFAISPNSIHVVYDGFNNLFSGLGVSAKTATALASESTVAATGYPHEVNQVSLIDATSRAISTAQQAKKFALGSSAESESLLRLGLIDAGISTGLSASLAGAIAPHFNELSLISYDFKDQLEKVIVHELYLSPYQARTVLESVDAEKVINPEAIHQQLANELVRSGRAGDLTEAMAMASVVTKNAMHVQGAFSSMVDFQHSILTNLSVGEGIDKNAGLDLLPLSSLDASFDRNVLKEGLVRGFANVGEEQAEAYASIVANAATPFARDAIDTVRHALVSTLSIDAAQADKVANSMDITGIIDVDGVKGQVSDIIAKAGESIEITDDVMKEIMAHPHALDSQDSFRKAFQDALFIVGVSPETANAMSDTLKVQGLYHLEKIKTSMVNALENAGFSVEEAKKLSAGAALNLFNMNSSEIDLHITSEMLRKNSVSGNSAQEELVHAIMNSTILSELIIQKNAAFKSIQNDVISAVMLVLDKRNAAVSEQSFRDHLADELAISSTVINSRIATSIAEEINISDIVRRELLIRDITLKAKEKLELHDETIETLKIVADEIYRDVSAFVNKETFEEKLLAMILHRKVLEEEDAKTLVSSLNVGMVIEGANPLFSSVASKTMPQYELREQLTQLITEHFKDAIPLDKAKRISEEFIMTLVGPLTVSANGPHVGSMLELIKEQVEVLVKQVESKNYRKFILQGVTDTMLSSTQVNYDTFMFTEILNANGRRFLELIQVALLNNIGADDRSPDQTIDLLI